MTTRVSVTRQIPASAAAIYEVISTPDGHVEIDGSGMLVTPLDGTPPSAVGDTFRMSMDREPLGDLPLGKYEVINTVTKREPPAVFEWGIGAFGRAQIGHVYGYELVEVGPAETSVTSYCDWSAIADERVRDRFPIVPVEMLERTVENLDRLMRQRT